MKFIVFFHSVSYAPATCNKVKTQIKRCVVPYNAYRARLFKSTQDVRNHGSVPTRRTFGCLPGFGDFSSIGSECSDAFLVVLALAVLALVLALGAQVGASRIHGRLRRVAGGDAI